MFMPILALLYSGVYSCPSIKEACLLGHSLVLPRFWLFACRVRASLVAANFAQLSTKAVFNILLESLIRGPAVFVEGLPAVLVARIIRRPASEVM